MMEESVYLDIVLNALRRELETGDVHTSGVWLKRCYDAFTAGNERPRAIHVSGKCPGSVEISLMRQREGRMSEHRNGVHSSVHE
jgi:hypothetical protein